MTCSNPRSYAALQAVFLTLFVGVYAAAGPSDDYLVYVDEDQVILQGHDPVALFTEGRLVRGELQHSSTYHGAVYRFSSATNQRSFEDAPEKYAPQFGGHCAMSMALGMLEPADVSTWSIVDGRLVVQRNAKAKRMWAKNPERNLKKADRNWPRFVEKHGKQG